ncbi:hypothetical protein C0J52_03886 [Blattella germanica]|nr:hypothetical protein C0J52_03886 [Blattella germanica]
MLLGTCYSPEHSEAMKHHHQLPVTASTSRASATSSTSSSPASSSSLFTIDSILAPRPSHQSPPAVSPPQQHVLSPHQRLPPAVLHHPLHLGHLAAAAASGFGATSADFLGMFFLYSPL